MTIQLVTYRYFFNDDKNNEKEEGIGHITWSHSRFRTLEEADDALDVLIKGIQVPENAKVVLTGLYPL